jgi:hypothetical protein
MWFDAGDGNLLSQVQLSSADRRNISGATWSFRAMAASDDIYTDLVTATTDKTDTSVAFRRDTISPARRWIALQIEYKATYVGDENERWRIVKDIALIGDHGVTLRQNGAGTDGFYPSDIANYVRQQAVSIDAGDIEESSGFTAIQVSYPERVLYEQIINDMASLMGWHWGVWEGRAFRPNPRFDFCARPSSPTAIVDKRLCSQVTLSKALSSMYNQARVSYTDAAGGRNSVLVELDHPDLSGGTNGRSSSTPDITRTIDLDLGIGTLDQATLYGTQILQLMQVDSRAQGSVSLPPVVDTPQGEKPSHLLRAGLDRLKIQGLPITSVTSLAESNGFRVKRVQSEVVGTGVKTTVEVDNGADLIEVLTARTAQAAFGVGGL